MFLAYRNLTFFLFIPFLPAYFCVCIFVCLFISVLFCSISISERQLNILYRKNTWERMRKLGIWVPAPVLSLHNWLSPGKLLNLSEPWFF